MIILGKKFVFGLHQFNEIVFKNKKVDICPESLQRLKETREFVDYLLKHRIKAYGITTGLADLRNQSIEPSQAAELSCNLISSHDTGIGPTLSFDVVFGAMAVRASSLAKGHSGVQGETLKTLMDMINCRIVPLVPKTGSLGASGDLAFLARLGRAMRGEAVPVWYEEKVQTADQALKKANISPFRPLAKEGLAITNGTSFMISMLGIAFLQEIHALENILAMQGLFLNAVGAVDAAFDQSVQTVRNQEGQKFVSQILSRHFEHSPFIDFIGIQDDYCIRCLPQIFGSKIELILEQYIKIERELDAVTDNPLIFKNNEISPTTHGKRIVNVNGEDWVILSGGNFHGECITTVVDAICAANVKIALTLERQITYMLNPFRNKNRLPCHLITDQSKAGLASGYMITQYTANALAQKISQLGVPTSIFNITSANESEDVVSYGASAAERLLEQLERLKELNTIFLTVVTQAYAIIRHRHLNNQGSISSDLLAEKIFHQFNKSTGINYPITNEDNFNQRYDLAMSFLETETLRSIMDYPLSKALKQKQNEPASEELSKLLFIKSAANQAVRKK